MDTFFFIVLNLFFVNRVCKYYAISLNKIKIFLPIPYIFSDIKYINYVYEELKMKIKKKYMLKLGIKYGNVCILNKLLSNIGNKYLKSNLYTYALRLEDYDKLNWLKMNKCVYNEENRYYAFQKCEENIYDEFNKSSNKLIKWFMKELIWDECGLFNFMKDNQDIESIKWVLKSVPDLKKYVCELAVELKNRDILEWGIKNKFRLSYNVSTCAAALADLELLKFLKKNKCPMNEWIITEGVINNNLEIIKWGYENKCGIESNALLFALQKRNDKIIEWLLSHNCTYDEYTIDIANKYGYEI
jgi:hypothetical protein